MATRDEPLNDVVGGLFISVPTFLHFSTVCHESPSEQIFKSKDVLESQDSGLEMFLGSNVPKIRSL
jgi:hypothetical protein